MKVFRTLRAPCQRCGQYHDSPAEPSKAQPRATTASPQAVADGMKDMAHRRAPEPPDLAAWIRKTRGGAK